MATGKKKAPLKKSVIQKASRRARLIKAVNKIANMDVEFISILTDGVKPANDCPILIKSVDGNKDKRELQMHIVSKSVKEGLLYATSMEPGKPDKQKDVATAEEIKKMSHSLMAKQVGIDHNHDLKKTDTKMVENFILRGTDPNFPNIVVGSACHVFKLGKDLIEKADAITGISVYGTTDREELEKDATTDQTAEPGIGPALKAMRIKAGVGDIQVATALGLDHQQYSDLESDTADIELTADQLKAVGKILKMDPLELAAELLGGAAADENAEDEPPADGSADTPPDPNAKPKDTTGLGKSQNMDKEKIKTEKKLLKSGTLIVKDGGEDQNEENNSLSKSVKPSDKQVNALCKGLLGFTDEGRERLKKGDIVSTDFAPGGDLAPEVGRTLLSLVRDQSAILKKINIHEVKRRDAEVLVNDFQGSLSRQAVGPVGSGTAEGVLNKSIKVSTQEIDLLIRIPNKTLAEYQTDLPGLEQMLLGMVQTGFANKLTKLAFMGTNRTYTPGQEMTLGQGFFDLALNGNVGAGLGFAPLPGAQIIDISDSGLDPTLPMEILDAMRLAFVTELPQYDAPSIPFFMGPTDFYAFGVELRQDLMGLQLQIDGVNPKYDGHPIETVNYITSQNYMLTPYNNLGIAVLNSASTDGGIKVQVSPIRKAVEWLFTMQVDFFMNSPIAILAKA